MDSNKTDKIESIRQQVKDGDLAVDAGESVELSPDYLKAMSAMRAECVDYYHKSTDEQKTIDQIASAMGMEKETLSQLLTEGWEKLPLTVFFKAILLVGKGKWQVSPRKPAL